MITFSLQSGSNGNCIYVEAGEVKLLFDAGISAGVARERLREKGREIKDCNALLISHDHRDHCRCAGVYQRKFKLPLYITPATLKAAGRLGRLDDVRHFRAGDRIQFGNVTVYTVPTPHDAVDGVVFVVEHDRRRLGILTDLGHPFPALTRLLPELDAAYLESNYDADMLESGPYSAALKDRIRGDGGHLSNAESALLSWKCSSARLRWVALAHLSEKNNRPDLALGEHRSRMGRQFPLHLAPRYEPGPTLAV